MASDPNPHPPRPWLRFGLALAIGGVSLYLLVSEFPEALENGDELPRLVALVLLLVVVGFFSMDDLRMSAGTFVRQASAWIAIGALAILAYSYRAEFQEAGYRIYGELRPHSALVGSDGNVVIRRSADGHFHVTANVEGRAIKFLVDTGATSVALTRADAESLGFDRSRLRFRIPVRTAGGVVPAAPVSLSSINIGNIEIRNVEALVSRHSLSQSLLGLSFLDRLSGYEVSGNTMILKP